PGQWRPGTPQTRMRFGMRCILLSKGATHEPDPRARKGRRRRRAAHHAPLAPRQGGEVHTGRRTDGWQWDPLAPAAHVNAGRVAPTRRRDSGEYAGLPRHRTPRPGQLRETARLLMPYLLDSNACILHLR